VLEAEGQIYFCLERRFKPQQLDEISQSGNPPEPTKIGGLTFYYNHPGGGVDYSDDYLFKLRGKLLHIEFPGPYTNDNKPAEETRKLEPKILTTFRIF
jgi:hypothetical protein